MFNPITKCLNLLAVTKNNDIKQNIKLVLNGKNMYFNLLIGTNLMTYYLTNTNSFESFSKSSFYINILNQQML